MRRPYSGAMANHPRYAIYYTARPDSALDRFGAVLLGYDAHSGEDLSFPDGLPLDWRELTRDPRKYGFHATLKAPIALADGKAEAQLAAACELFADLARPVPVIQPVVDSISGFIAVIPGERSADLDLLAAQATRAFDSFRAPLSPEDRARRSPEALTPRQRDYLDRWGYPYVFEEFRFHMTLTGRLPAERREPIVAMLRSRFSTTGIGPIAIDAIALCRQDNANSRFRVIGRWQLRD
ncbi:putative phosphonate metabolism protein [Bradyrhizobium sp. AZCC 1578]